MRISLVFAFFLTTVLPIFAQQPEGTFRTDADSIVFSGNDIYFSLRGFAGLNALQVGRGTFEVVDNFIIVQTSDFSGDRTSSETVAGASDEYITVIVVDSEMFWVQGIFVESLDGRGRRIERRLTNNQGTALLPRSANIERIVISGMGFDNYSFEYTSGSDHHIRLAQHEVIENTTAVFRFNKIDDEFLSLLLLTADFQEGRNRDRALRQLDNRAQRNNRMERRFRRVEEPVEIEWRFPLYQ